MKKHCECTMKKFLQIMFLFLCRFVVYVFDTLWNQDYGKFINWIHGIGDVSSGSNFVNCDNLHTEEELLNQEITTLKLKLNNAKHLLDVEKLKRLKVMDEYTSMIEKIAVLLKVMDQSQDNEALKYQKLFRQLKKLFQNQPTCLNDTSILSEKYFTFNNDCMEEVDGNTNLSDSQIVMPESFNVDDHLDLQQENEEVLLNESFQDTEAVVDRESPELELTPVIKKVSSESNIPDVSTQFDSSSINSTCASSVTLDCSGIYVNSHVLHIKKFFSNETCQMCNKKINLGRNAYKCRQCKIVCHTKCKELLNTPCSPKPKKSKCHKKIISDFSPKSGPMVPELIVLCTSEIETRGFHEIGLYRVPGCGKEVKQLTDKLMNKGTADLSSYRIHVVCGSLKLFLRSLREPLVTSASWISFFEASQIQDVTKRNEALQRSISMLPQSNRDTISWLLLHLHRIASITFCQMPVENLVKIFAPNIVGYSTSSVDPSTVCRETPQQLAVCVMKCLMDMTIEYWRDNLMTSENSFTAQTSKSKKRTTSIRSRLQPGKYSTVIF